MIYWPMPCLESPHDDLNDSISDDEIVEMLAQHLITKPVFDSLFEGYSFASHNPMSLAMQAVLDQLQEHRLDKEADTLQSLYDSVKVRAAGVKTDKASGIVNDANAWAIETMHNPRYPLELFCRVVTVSLETMNIVRSLPRLDILASH